MTKGLYPVRMLVHFRESIQLYVMRHGRLPFPKINTIYTYKMIG